MTAPIDYNAVLADLLVKRGQIDAAIEVIRAMIGGAAAIGDPSTNGGGEGISPAPTMLGSSPKPPGQPQGPTIQTDAFFGLNTSDAIRKYLGMMKRPQTAQTITNALMAGGQVNASDPKVTYSNVYSALTRNKTTFVKTRTKEWGLAEWYSANRPKGDSE
jgi:hypothetical protein